MMYIMLSLFYFKVVDISVLEVIDSWIFSEIAILEWSLTWHMEHSISTVCTYFERNTSCI